MAKNGATTTSSTKQKGKKPAVGTVPETVVTNVTSEQREKMIAEAAYYLAEMRGFQDGHAQQDWLRAEANVDQMLNETFH